MNNWDIINLAEQKMNDPDFMKYSDDIENILSESKKEYENGIDKMSELVEHTLLKKAICNAGGISDVQTMDEIKVIRCKSYGKFIVTDLQDNIIIPLGKYSFIDTLGNGYLRVNVQDENEEKHWGIINSHGKEVLPLCYDRIWSLNCGFDSVKVYKQGQVFFFNLITGELTDNKYGNNACKKNSDDDYISEEERRQIDRDNFYALTDGVYGDYEDYCDSGYNEDDIRTFMGLD